MNVLHILGSLNIGGAENLVLNLLETASKNGSPNKYSIVYMHPSKSNRVELFCKLSDVSLIECNKGLGSTLKFIKALRKYICKNNIETIHCHNNIDAYWAYLASFKTSVKKIVLTVHGLNLDFNFLGKKVKVFGNADRFILKHLSKTYVSAVTRDFYKSKYGYNELEGEIIYNGVKFHPETLTENFILNKADYTKNHPLANNEWVQPGKLAFGMVGNFNTPVRLQLLLCKAIGMLNEKYKGHLPFTFVFVGGMNTQNPELYNQCIEYCKSNSTLNKDIFFLGSRNDVKEILTILNGYVYCSSGDSFGLSVIEAIGAGLPTVCSNIGTFREVLDNGKYGYLVNNDALELSNAIEKLYINITNKKEPLLDGVLNMAPFIVRDLYSLEKCLCKFETEYKK